MSRISVQAYTLRKRMQTPEGADAVLRALADMGLEWIQPAVPAFWTAEEFGRRLRGYGLRADSFACQDPDLTGKREALLRTAQALDARVIRGPGMSRRQAMDRDAALAWVREAQRQAAALRTDGLTVVYHFHDYEFCDLGGGETPVDLLLRYAPDLMFQPDVHWLAAAGFPPEKKLYGFAGRCAYVHMQDYAMLPDGETIRPETVPVGAGNLNWEGIVKTCEAIGVKLYVIEQDNCQKDELESAADSVRTLRRLGIE